MARAMILGLSGPRLTEGEARFMADAAPWGFILFRRNIADADQVRALCAELRAAVGWDAPVFVDQEGGSVQRLRPPLAADWPDACIEAHDPRAVWLRHRLMAAELTAVGLDGNCAPVIDVGSPATHPFLRRRIWSNDPAQVADLGRAAALGLLAGGVLPVIKHLPGHGSADADSHHALPRVRDPLAVLEARDFAPVRALADLPLGMSAHVIYEALDPDRAGTISPVVIAHLRGALGFGGLLMTDDICMNALGQGSGGGAIGARAGAALAAGCDVVLHCSGDLAEMEQVAAACPLLSGDAGRRADAARAARRPAQPVDMAALAAELGALRRPESA